MKTYLTTEQAIAACVRIMNPKYEQRRTRKEGSPPSGINE